MDVGQRLVGHPRAAWRRSLAGWRGWLLLATALASAAVVTAIALTGHAISHG